MLLTMAPPISMIVAMTAMLSVSVKPAMERVPYFLFAYTGMVTVLLLVNMVSNGLPGIVANMNLPKSSNFPWRVAGADGWDISISLESQNAGKFS